ncbi:MAG: serine protease [Deltaproteobacteria bacterium]|nr:serine protease [Deltaproteobacteria bacterium]
MKLYKKALLTLFITFIAGPAHADRRTEEVYSRYKDQVLQVKILDRSSNTKSGIGSGFVVSTDGFIVTNYHVVSQLVHRPESYRAEYLKEDGSKGDLTLITLDVVHDLALLKADDLRENYFELERKVPVKGESLFSLGNPYDLGLTIVEGTYNGLLEKSLYEKIHFTGSINPGMSGGPALNRKGRVVGVNVSTAGNQVSFLVPVKYVIAMLEGALDEDAPVETPVETVRRQLLHNQARYMDDLLGDSFETVPMGRYLLPAEVASYIKCWGNTNKKEDLFYEGIYQSCSAEDDIYLTNRLSSGAIRFRHDLFTTGKLGPLRFFGLLEKRFQMPHMSLGGDEESVASYRCHADFINNGSLEFKAVFCMRKYKKLADLYDSFMTLMTLSSGSEALHSTLVLSGVSYENAANFNKSFIEAIRWK